MEYGYGLLNKATEVQSNWKKKSNTFNGEHTTVLGILFKKLNYKERRKSTDLHNK